jgi:hypothetical protein
MIHQINFFGGKNKNKIMYMLGYVHPNIVIKKLQQIHQTPLYINANFIFNQSNKN